MLLLVTSAWASPASMDCGKLAAEVLKRRLAKKIEGWKTAL